MLFSACKHSSGTSNEKRGIKSPDKSSVVMNNVTDVFFFLKDSQHAQSILNGRRILVGLRKHKPALTCKEQLL